MKFRLFWLGNPSNKSQSAFAACALRYVLTFALGMAVTGAAVAQTITLVNGRPVMQALADQWLARNGHSGQVSAESQAEARDEVVAMVIYAQEAERRGLAIRPGTSAQDELKRLQVLAQGLVLDYLVRNRVSEPEIRARYDEMKAATLSEITQYRLRHILLDSKEDAQQVTKEIQNGANFAAIARARSKDVGSAANGGDLDYLTLPNIAGTLALAVQKLKKGQVSSEPIKTEFGWHVIRVDDIRTPAYPEYAETREAMKESAEKIKLQRFLNTLRREAKTSYKFTLGTDFWLFDWLETNVK